MTGGDAVENLSLDRPANPMTIVVTQIDAWLSVMYPLTFDSIRLQEHSARSFETMIKNASK